MNSPESSEYKGKLLDLQPQEDGSFRFLITPETTSQDLKITMAYLRPDPNRAESAWRHILWAAINVKDALNGHTFIIGQENIVGEKVIIDRAIRFGDGVTLEEVESGLTAAFSEEEMPDKRRQLVEWLVDNRKLDGIGFIDKAEHEFASADDASIAQEMAWLTFQQYNEE